MIIFPLIVPYTNRHIVKVTGAERGMGQLQVRSAFWGMAVLAQRFAKTNKKKSRSTPNKKYSPHEKEKNQNKNKQKIK